MWIVWALLIFYGGFMLGFFICRWLQYRTGYTGALLVTEEDDKRLYSLVLDNYPETIELKKEVILKVVHAEEKADRD